MEFTIKSFEDACKYLGEPNCLPEEGCTNEKWFRANEIHHQLMIITAALNKEANAGQEWIPDWNNSNEWKYYPWFTMRDEPSGQAGSGFSYCDCADGASVRVSRPALFSFRMKSQNMQRKHSGISIWSTS